MATETLPATKLPTRLELTETANEVAHAVSLLQWIEDARQVFKDLEWVKEYAPESSVKEAAEKFKLHSPEWDEYESYALQHMLSAIATRVERLDCRAEVRNERGEAS